ncbi:MAG: hypothetical protein IT416_04395 [Candidatus Pacebacteria bacterium]|nr:hypothetical protein [Candidatus Paceibacterota bacterium]
MSFKLPFLAKNKAQDNHSAVPENSFIGLVFTDSGVRAVFWRIEAGRVILDQKKSAIHNFTNDEEAIVATDEALNELVRESEAVNEVVFGFDPKWVGETGLIKDKKPLIKKLTDSLSLKPVGFVVVTDALVQDIFSREKTVSQIVIYIQENTLYLMLLKKGKLVQQISVGRSEAVVSDIVEGLARLNTDGDEDGYLPAKMVLASLVLADQDLQDVRTSIIGYDWADKHPFVQAPLIEKLQADHVLDIIIEQGGLAVAETKGLTKPEIGGENSNSTGEKLENLEDFGFSNVDTKVIGDNFSQVETKEEKTTATSFGIPIAEAELPKERKTLVSRSDKEDDLAKKQTHQSKKPMFMNKFFSWYQHHPHKKIILGGIIGGVIASIALFIGGLVLSYKVEVNVELAEKVISKEVELTVDTTVATSNVEKLTLRGELEKTEYTDTKVVATTGVKLVGEKATGQVTILNKTTSPKTFAAGTVFSTGTLNFTLNEETTVASASVTTSGTSETKDYGKQDAKITASKIGADSNIAEETELTIANFDKSTYSASVVETFTGGSSREVRVISQEDKALVLSELKQTLFKKAQEDYKNKSGNGTYYALSGKQKVITAEYSSEVGEEEDELALDLSMEFEAIRYLSEDIKPLAVDILKEDLPANYEFTAEDPEILTSPKEEATGSSQVVLTANVSAKALPIFDQQNLLSILKGLPLSDVIGRTTERPEIKAASYQLKPGLVGAFVSTVPQAEDRIIINIQEKD